MRPPRFEQLLRPGLTHHRPGRSKLLLDDERGGAFARSPGAAAGEALQHFAIPQAYKAHLKAPLAVRAFYRMVIIPAGKAQQIRRFTFAFGDKGKAFNLHAAIILREIFYLRDVVLAAG